jgi:pyruvate dehydrogenase E1 component alpha subunit
MHLIDKSVNFMGSSAIVGNSIPVGVGLGYHIKANNQDALSFVFLGDGAIEEGSFYESASFAVLKNLPVIFICENNGYSVYSNLLSRQKSINTIEDTARGIGLEYLKSDGNNAVEAFNLMKILIERSKALNKPGFIELTTSRKLEHCGPDIDHYLHYRTPNELQELDDNDPLKILRNLITQQGDLETDEWITGLEKQIQTEIDQAFTLASQARFPTLKEVT